MGVRAARARTNAMNVWRVPPTRRSRAKPDSAGREWQIAARGGLAAAAAAACDESRDATLAGAGGDERGAGGCNGDGSALVE